MIGDLIFNETGKLSVRNSITGVIHTIHWNQKPIRARNQMVHVEPFVLVEYNIMLDISSDCYNNPFCEADETCIGCTKEFAHLR